MIYFTSDLHLGHEQAIHFTNRPYADVEEMNRALIQNINDAVLPDDTLWVLGDFAFKVNREVVRDFRKQIHCKNVHLVVGNHDKDYSNDHIFQSVQHYKELKTEYGKFILFHYPILEWNTAHYGSVHLHGHIYSTGEYNAANLEKRLDDRLIAHTLVTGYKLRIYDVGVDANGYRTISMERLVEIMQLTPINPKK